MRSDKEVKELAQVGICGNCKQHGILIEWIDMVDQDEDPIDFETKFPILKSHRNHKGKLCKGSGTKPEKIYDNQAT